MRIKTALIFFFLEIALCQSSSIEISQAPFVVAYTPNSVLSKPISRFDIRYAGTRPRYSTCSAVAWDKKDRNLFAVNMQDCSIEFYQFNPENRTIQSIRNFNNKDGMDLARPESVAISMAGTLLAVPNMTTGKVHIYEMQERNGIDPHPIKTIYGHQPHGVQFSPDGRYLACASTNESGVSIYDITGTPQFIQSLGVPFSPLKSKTVAFSLDGHYLIVGYCIKLSKMVHKAQGLIAVYEFDVESGKINPNPIDYHQRVPSVETIAFFPNGRAFFSVDQVYDRVFGHEFDPETGKIGESWVALEGEQSQLDLPHGLSFTSDGKFLAVSNYGDDKVTIHEVN